MAWVGDGNNIIHSLMMGGLKMGLNISVATPEVISEITGKCGFIDLMPHLHLVM